MKYIKIPVYSYNELDEFDKELAFDKVAIHKETEYVCDIELTKNNIEKFCDDNNILFVLIDGSVSLVYATKSEEYEVRQ